MPSISLAEDLKGSINYTQSQYRVGPGDVLTMQVYNQQDLAQSDIMVREDGFATFNGAGDILVAGKSLGEVSVEVKEKLSDLIVDPVVTIAISHTKPGIIYLAGAVKHPGMYQLTTASKKDSYQVEPVARVDLRLSNILANAGGVLTNADLSRIEVKRAESGQKEVVDLMKMLKEGNAEEDILVKSGDSVFVPQLAQGALNEADYSTLLRSSIGPGTFPVRVIGEVGTPGVYDLNGESPYLNSAIAKAGGFKENSNREKVAIRRFTGKDTFDTLFVEANKMDTVLQPNDVVFISEQKVYKTGRFAETVSRVFSPFTAAASTAFNLIWAMNAGRN